MLGSSRFEWGVPIPLRDGTRLSATRYMPGERPGPTPCLLDLTPYTAHRNHSRARYFASHGYSVLVVDSRGRGNSEGTFRTFIQEAKDGFDVVEWIAKQPFCNGAVAMFGGSYEGYVQWAIAKEFPPHLATIVPAASAAPGIEGNPMRSNIACPYVMRWLTSITGRTHQERIFEDQEFWRERFREWFESGRPFKELDSLIGNPSPTFQEWLSHPTQDSYWDSHRPKVSEYAGIELPILTITGIYDSDQLGALHYYREHVRHGRREVVANHYLVIGPWDHAGTLAPKPEFGGMKFGPAALIDVLRLHVEWYDWILRDGSKPSFLRKRVAYYVIGAETWRYADSLEEITAVSKAFYLDSSGASTRILASGFLSETVGRGAPDSYVHDPSDVSIARVEANLDYPPQLSLLRPTFPADSLVDGTFSDAMDGKALFYHSSPFPQATAISGFFRLTVWLSIDQLDTDFIATVYEVVADGGSVLLTSDLMRARYRESLREEKLIQTTKPLRYEFDQFTFVSRQIEKGSRLRLVIGPINSIHYQKNYNSGKVVSEECLEDAKPVTVRLFHDEEYPSALFVPIGSRAA